MEYGEKTNSRKVERLENPGVQKRFVKRLHENIQTNQSEKETQTIESL